MSEKRKAELEILTRAPTITQAFRVTADERAQLVEFAKSKAATISDVIRSALVQVGVIEVEHVA